MNALSGRGVTHDPQTPSLQMVNVSVVYAAGLQEVSVGGHGGKVSSERSRNGRSHAVENISFTAQQGERIAVVGPNGAGKSTLFKLIVGTVKPSEGQVQIFGHGPDGHICIGYVPQRNEIDWSFPVTVEDVVMMGRVGQIGLFRWPRRADWELVRHSLDRVGVSHLAKKQIGELSGGQQQRVFIARALAQEAELLLLDEPLNGLDLPTQQTIFDVLDSLRPDGVTVLVATHDLQLAADRFDKIMLINRQIIAFAAPTAVLTSENLLQAYGGHVHHLPGAAQAILVDDCCGHDEPVIGERNADYR
ncbi:metal ABC transporter ATP-binding protein [Candidatus Leptofilum sp.]|uniref:metal ABC transporter ATP-binding protein n=1 Tax=Candidatus Leptofilum sp. TaxID=3241576 RepID=UPI003B59D6DD